MKVSFSFGPKSTVQLVNTLKNMADNVEFFSYKNIAEMIKSAELRHIYFDRIIFSEKIISNPKKELALLNDYIKNNSDSTEIVFVANPKGSKAAPVFSEIFNSPLYTPVILEKPTPTVLLELIQSDILNLKTKYYVLDVKKQQALTVTNTDTPEPKKGIFGGKKQNVVAEMEAKETAPEVGESASNGIDGSVVGDVPDVAGFGGFATPIAGGFADEVSQNSGLFNNSPLGGGAEDATGENSGTSEEDNELGIGDFGSQHSDTGFLNEDEEAELEEAMQQRNQSTTAAESPEKPAGITALVSPKPVAPETRIFLFTGEKGSGVTQFVIDKAAKVVDAGKTVLVIDLDTEANGVLALLDTPKFYSRKCQNGLSNRIVYSEDGVDVVSNGFGGKVTPQMVDTAVESFSSKYDSIFIDCPVKYLKLVSQELLEKASVTVIAKGERSSLISTSLALTNREYLTLDAEREIMNKCRVTITDKDNEFFEEDLGYVRSVAMFPNGNWLERVS